MTGTGKGMGTGMAMEEGKRNEMRDSTGRGIVEQTPGWDDITRAVPWQLPKVILKADSDMDS